MDGENKVTQNVPSVSVVMSTYNETPSQLKESIESILDQSFKNFEFIIVNDNPLNKELYETLLYYKTKDNRIVIIENEENIGLSCSLNKAIYESRTDYIMRMDADDISIKNRMEYQYRYMKTHPKVAMMAGSKEDIDENSEKIPGRELPRVNSRNIKRILKYGNPIVHPSVMIRKKVLEQLQGYRDIKGGEDYDLWLRMVTSGYEIAVLYDQPVLLYRIRNNGITRSDFFWAYFSGQYARKLYRERRRKGRDSYTYNNMKAYQRMLKQDCIKYEAVNAIYQEIGKGNIKNKIIKIIRILYKCPSAATVVGNMLMYKISEKI